VPSLRNFYRLVFSQSRPPSPACCGQRALERCCTKTGQRCRRGAGDALARRIVAHVSQKMVTIIRNNMFSNFCDKCNFLRKPCPTTKANMRKGISGEGHGNLEADLAVLTPAFGSCSCYRYCPSCMIFISVSSSGPRCPPRALRTNSSDVCRRERVVGFMW